MKTIPLLLSIAAVCLGGTAQPAQAQPLIPGPAYVRSTLGSPWGPPPLSPTRGTELPGQHSEPRSVEKGISYQFSYQFKSVHAPYPPS
jgi:hypothetical protein